MYVGVDLNNLVNGFVNISGPPDRHRRWQPRVAHIMAGATLLQIGCKPQGVYDEEMCLQTYIRILTLTGVAVSSR